MAQESRLIVSVSGVRGVVGEALTVDVAVRFAQAFGMWRSGQPVLVSRDSRPSGEMFGHAVIAGLSSVGCPVFPLGIVPTPTCGFAAAHASAGAIQITASHNPAPYNGLKLFGPDGRVLSADRGREVLQLYHADRLRSPSWNELGRIDHDPQANRRALEQHCDRIIALVPPDRIRNMSYRILVDGNNGAGGPLAVILMQQLGCQVVPVGCDQTGQFAHEPEPIQENLAEVALRVRAENCHVGFALDPDADRLAIIDETGRFIGEELTLALAMEYRLRQVKGPVVANMSTSRVVEVVARRHGCSFHRAPVGEANVVDRMLSVNAVIGGEGNGGVIDPRVVLVRDPFIAMAMILDLMAESGSSISQLVSTLPTFHIVKQKAELDRSRLSAYYEALEGRWPEAVWNRDDGLRLDLEESWLHVRPSNTEPIVRIIAEAPTVEEARELCRQASECLPS